MWLNPVILPTEEASGPQHGYVPGTKQVVRATPTASTTSAVVTLATPAVAGNLLVALVGGDKNIGAPIMPGWTIAYSLPSSSVSQFVAYKVADGGETTVNVGWTTGTSGGNTVIVTELYTEEGVGTWQVLGTATAITNETSQFSKSTGTVGALSYDGLALALGSVDSSDAMNYLNDTERFTNGFELLNKNDSASSARASLSVGSKQVVAGAATETTYSYTPSVSGDQLTTSLIVFSRVGDAPSAGVVSYLMSGAMTATGATVAAKVTSGKTARLKVSTAANLSVTPTFSGSVPIFARFARMNVTGLNPATVYYYGVEVDGVLDTATVGKFKTAPATDRLTNPGFEGADLSPWYSDTGFPTIAQISDGTAQEGSKHMRVTATQSGIFQASYSINTIPAVPGEAWSARVLARHRAGTARPFRLVMHFYNSDVSLQTGSAATTSTALTTAWSEYALTDIVAPADTAWVRIVVHYISGTSGDAFEVDAPLLTKSAANAASFKFAVGSCLDNTDSLAMSRLQARNPDFLVHMGDFHYYDHSTRAVQPYRSAIDSIMALPNVGAALRNTAMVYRFSDHDSGGPGANKLSAGMIGSTVNYHERVPHYPLASTSMQGIWHTFTYGRARFIVLDERTYASTWQTAESATKTKLGDAQKQWLKDTITAATEKVIFIVGETTWIGTTGSDDNWTGFTTERAELASFFQSSGKRLIYLAGDAHSLAADTGSNSPGGIPVIQAAPFYNQASQKGGGTYTYGPIPATGTATVQQYGMVEVADNGTTDPTITFRGYDTADAEVITMTLGVAAPVGSSVSIHTGGGVLVTATLLGIHDGAGGFTAATLL